MGWSSEEIREWAEISKQAIIVNDDTKLAREKPSDLISLVCWGYGQLGPWKGRVHMESKLHFLRRVTKTREGEGSYQEESRGDTKLWIVCPGCADDLWDIWIGRKRVQEIFLLAEPREIPSKKKDQKELRNRDRIICIRSNTVFNSEGA